MDGIICVVLCWGFMYDFKLVGGWVFVFMLLLSNLWCFVGILKWMMIGVKFLYWLLLFCKLRVLFVLYNVEGGVFFFCRWSGYIWNSDSIGGVRSLSFSG